MSNHIFRCKNSSDAHVIFDISDEPVPHIGEMEKIYCPTCEKDVLGEYLGQAINFDTSAIGSTLPEEDVELYTVDDGSPYCIHCDGACEK